MSPAQIFIAGIGLVMAAATFCLLRYPRMRRPQFRHLGACSLGQSLLGAAAILTVIALMVMAQGAWQRG